MLPLQLAAVLSRAADSTKLEDGFVQEILGMQDLLEVTVTQWGSWSNELRVIFFFNTASLFSSPCCSCVTAAMSSVLPGTLISFSQLILTLGVNPESGCSLLCKQYKGVL